MDSSSEKDRASKSDWKIGKRVSRPDGDDFGTVIALERDQIKVKWDGDATSYYALGKPINVRLVRGDG